MGIITNIANAAPDSAPEPNADATQIVAAPRAAVTGCAALVRYVELATCPAAAAAASAIQAARGGPPTSVKPAVSATHATASVAWGRCRRTGADRELRTATGSEGMVGGIPSSTTRAVWPVVSTGRSPAGGPACGPATPRGRFLGCDALPGDCADLARGGATPSRVAGLRGPGVDPRPTGATRPGSWIPPVSPNAGSRPAGRGDTFGSPPRAVGARAESMPVVPDGAVWTTATARASDTPPATRWRRCASGIAGLPVCTGARRIILRSSEPSRSEAAAPRSRALAERSLSRDSA